MIPLRLYPLAHPLINLREAVAHLFGAQPKQVDDQDIARGRGQVLAVAIRADMPLQTGNSSQSERGGLFRGDDEARAMQLHAGATQIATRPQRQRAGHIRADGQIRVDESAPLAELHLDGIAIRAAFVDDRPQPARRFPGHAHAHRNPHRRAVAGIHPGMIGDGEGEGEEIPPALRATPLLQRGVG